MNPNISEAKLQANIANAQKSTGPKTPEGQAASAKNSLQHGLNASAVLILPGEQEEYDQLKAQLGEQLRPDNIIEETLFCEVLISSWNLRRVHRLQTAVQEGVDPLEALDDEALQKKLDRLHRHHTRLERSYHRNLKELKALQTERHNRAVMTPEFPVSISPLVDSIQISKRTQARQADYRKVPSDYESFTFDTYFARPRQRPEPPRRPVFQNEPTKPAPAAPNASPSEPARG